VRIGKRGTAGGIKIANDREEALKHAEAILGMDIGGFRVHEVWVEQASKIDAEYYASIILDRSEKKLLAMLSAIGGMDVEEMAEKDPEALVKRHIAPGGEFGPEHAEQIAADAKIDGDVQKGVAELLMELHEVALEEDATLIEVNPLIVTEDRRVIALDSKMTIDNNALFRHEDVAEMRDPEAYPPEERAAREKGVTYVKLDGEVGILGNGAGLVMSTLDVIALAGGRPANFCDLGGGGDAQGVVDALEVITGDPQVKSILFNIFAGITRCDVVAQGILQALSQITISHPIVVRFDGTNAEEGRQILAEAAPPNLQVEPTMLDAARRAVELAA
jgi:succinyl-CoA synthetase beta subunit